MSNLWTIWTLNSLLLHSIFLRSELLFSINHECECNPAIFSHGSKLVPRLKCNQPLHSYANNCVDKQDYGGSKKIFMGNNEGLNISHFGTSFISLDHVKNIKLHLLNLFHVFYIRKNLISVSKYTQDNNVYFEFHPRFFLVKDCNLEDNTSAE